MSPTPKEKETESEFIGRCIRYLRREGKTTAVSKGVTDMEAIQGKCFGLWRGKHSGKGK